MNDLQITVYTDGGNRNTGNKLGQHVKNNDLSAWAYLIKYQDQELTASGFQLGATNNAMELTAILEAFKDILSSQKLDDKPILLISDSHYVLDPMSKGWLNNWIKSGQDRPNINLWRALYPLYIKLKPRLTLKWVKGHQNTSGNIRVDDMLNSEMDRHH
ncbi:ribonuclease H family protein [Oenococcus kitaharae]|uniref:Ribonuclease HI n=1 Tax=Oenococcus kitaharae DSM 17330 TaxID=1045004 RepID=G9WJS1_9LACO|nr:ribonuclease H [Oenococcus kitaharae]EHN59270.1 Ribonuclease HI [Oenococcus kitaharae DSM 17330]OEY82204.1 ribonuclease H [Oenococcus kitaharae]OEY82627.1 ribonuclease H [Oenococcus kitaharae]OEY84884.1 ribonuclease H [Oenococcus kitaharae]